MKVYKRNYCYTQNIKLKFDDWKNATKRIIEDE